MVINTSTILVVNLGIAKASTSSFFFACHHIFLFDSPLKALSAIEAKN
jgi:hypothetical protein